MINFNRKPTALENLRAAQKNLEHTKTIAPQERLRAIQNAGHRGTAEWHPCEDHANLIIAEAELKLAEASVAYASAEPEGIQLCSALDAALVATRDQLAPIKDEPEPTLASTPEAKAEYEERCTEHAAAVKANASARLSIIGDAAKRIVKAAQASPRMLDTIGELIADAKAQLAAVVDPEAPVLGAPSPVTVSALSRALAAHRTHIEANEKRRQAIREDLVPVLRGIQAGFEALARKRRDQGLPGPCLWRQREFAGERPSLEQLASEAVGGELTPAQCDQWRGRIGYHSNGCEGPKAALHAIADRRAAWEQRQEKARLERERATTKHWG